MIVENMSRKEMIENIDYDIFNVIYNLNRVI